MYVRSGYHDNLSNISVSNAGHADHPLQQPSLRQLASAQNSRQQGRLLGNTDPNPQVG